MIWAPKRYMFRMRLDYVTTIRIRILGWIACSKSSSTTTVSTKSQYSGVDSRISNHQTNRRDKSNAGPRKYSQTNTRRHTHAVCLCLTMEWTDDPRITIPSIFALYAGPWRIIHTYVPRQWPSFKSFAKVREKYRYICNTYLVVFELRYIYSIWTLEFLDTFKI